MSELKTAREVTEDRLASLKRQDPPDSPQSSPEVPPEVETEPFDIMPLTASDQQNLPITSLNGPERMPQGDMGRVTIAMMQFLDLLTGAYVIDPADEKQRMGWIGVTNVHTVRDCLGTIFTELNAFVARKQAEGIPLDPPPA